MPGFDSLFLLDLESGEVIGNLQCGADTFSAASPSAASSTGMFGSSPNSSPGPFGSDGRGASPSPAAGRSSSALGGARLGTSGSSGAIGGGMGGGSGSGNGSNSNSKRHALLSVAGATGGAQLATIGWHYDDVRVADKLLLLADSGACQTER